MQKVYLDSNVFIAWVKEDMGKPFKLMYQDADLFFRQCPGRYVLVLSDLFLKEVKDTVFYSREDLLDFFEKRNIQFELFFPAESDMEKSIEFIRMGIHKADALHAAFAIGTKCDFLLTFNTKDFLPAKKLIDVKEPRELSD